MRTLWNSVLSDTHIFSPSLINEARIGYVRSLNPTHGPLRGQDVLQEVGIQGLSNVPDAYGMPQIMITGLGTLTQIQQQVAAEQGTHFNDSLTWIHRNHTFKFVVDVRKVTPNTTTVPVGAFGNFNFTGTFSGNAYSDFLLGLPQVSSVTPASPPSYRRQTEWAGFAQDDMKIGQRLTLQLGLRYEYQTPTRNLLDATYNFDPATQSLVVPSDDALSLVSPLFNRSIPITVADGSRFPEGRLWWSDKNNFAPRIGFAYRPGGSSDFAVRGAWGVYYDKIGFGLLYSGGPFAATAETYTNAVVNGAPLFQFPLPFPNTQAGASTAQPNVNAVLTRMSNPYVQQWNLSLEKGIRDVGLRASYIGTKATGLMYARNINQPPPSTVPFVQGRRPYPAYRDIVLTDQGGNSIYHAFQLEAKRRLQSLTFNIGYTWQSMIDDVADNGNDVATQIPNPFDRRSERARESYSLTHRFVASAIWQIPFGRGRRFGSHIPGWANQIFGGWETIWTAYLQTGPWFNPTFSGSDPSNTNTIGGRPDALRSGEIPDPNVNRWFDPTAFAVPPANAGRFGNSGRNILEAPGMRVLHLGVAKEFRIYEKAVVTFEVAARNLFNHPNFGLPVTDITNPSAGRILGFPDSLLAGEARAIQMRLFLRW